MININDWTTLYKLGFQLVSDVNLGLAVARYLLVPIIKKTDMSCFSWLIHIVLACRSLDMSDGSYVC
jgi:hypothetical protein